MGTRRRIALARVQLRRPLAGIRPWPDFLIIGTQRGGTSSLYRYLGRHPDVIPSVRKETEYFSSAFVRGPSWYRAHFPARPRGWLHEVFGDRPVRTFEATPDYLFDPRAPGRVAAVMPDCRLVVLLRDPVERAFSHYKHMQRLGFETLSFEDALAAEPERVDADLRHALADPAYRPRAALRYSYVSRGLYADQLERWLELFPREHLLVLDSAELFATPEQALHRICHFVGIRTWAPPSMPNHSYGSATAQRRSRSQVMEPETRAGLTETFRTANERLVDLVGVDPLVRPQRPQATA